MSPVEHGDLVGRQATGCQPFDFSRHPARLRLLGLGMVIERLFLAGTDGFQLLFHALAVVGDERVGRR